MAQSQQQAYGIQPAQLQFGGIAPPQGIAPYDGFQPMQQQGPYTDGIYGEFTTPDGYQVPAGIAHTPDILGAPQAPLQPQMQAEAPRYYDQFLTGDGYQVPSGIFRDANAPPNQFVGDNMGSSMVMSLGGGMGMGGGMGGPFQFYAETPAAIEPMVQQSYTEEAKHGADIDAVDASFKPKTRNVEVSKKKKKSKTCFCL